MFVLKWDLCNKTVWLSWIIGFMVYNKTETKNKKKDKKTPTVFVLFYAVGETVILFFF
jgi:hypothetical protein